MRVDLLSLAFMCGVILQYGQTAATRVRRDKGGKGCKSRGGRNEIWNSNKYKYCSYDHVLSNMFYREKEILNSPVINREIAKLEKYKVWNVTDDPNILPTRQLQDYLEQNLRHKRSTSSCCETTWTCISPEQVSYGGTTYDVYQPADGYQLLFLGQCGAGETCDFGKCVEEDNYHTWIIIIAHDVAYDPPILFVPIQFNNFCYCATI